MPIYILLERFPTRNPGFMNGDINFKADACFIIPTRWFFVPTYGWITHLCWCTHTTFLTDVSAVGVSETENLLLLILEPEAQYISVLLLMFQWILLSKWKRGSPGSCLPRYNVQKSYKSGMHTLGVPQRPSPRSCPPGQGLCEQSCVHTGFCHLLFLQTQTWPQTPDSLLLSSFGSGWVFKKHPLLFFQGAKRFKVLCRQIFLSHSWTEANRQALWRRTRMVSVPLREFMRNSVRF